jgi:rhodanese-related sulfurtransferase
MGVVSQTIQKKAPQLAELVSNTNGFAGDVPPADAYAFLAQNAGVLVDVRTAPEWQFVGIPNLAGTPSQLRTISWKLYPQFNTNPEFIAQLQATGATVDTPIFFLCRTGGRSTDAAIAATAAGFNYAFNVADGFEGDVNERGQRGAINGWKAAQLPWEQK